MERQNLPTLTETIRPFLGLDDDPDFWRQAAQVLVSDIESEIAEARPNRDIYLNVGACSHWWRPHQSRWTAAGGFAWPTGYRLGVPTSRALPRFDWSVLFLRSWDSENWAQTDRFKGKRELTFRAALPTRTRRHAQAAVHTMWSPGSPGQPRKKQVRFYGFRKQRGNWACVASSDMWEERS